MISCWNAVRARVPTHVTLVAVSKTKPAAAVAELLSGTTQRDFGENYIDELIGKDAELAPKHGDELRWHFIGALQSNKAKQLSSALGRRLAAVHALASAKAARRLAAGVPTGHTVDVFVQLNVSGEASKSGVRDTPPEDKELRELIAVVSDLDPALRLAGLMAIGAPGDTDDFARLTAARDRVADVLGANGRGLSMGMSADYEQAIEAGSTAPPPQPPVGELAFSHHFWSRARARDVPWDHDVPVFEDESAPKIRIFLVRHGQSLANVERTYYKRVADHAIALSPLGERQALEAGRALADYITARPGTFAGEHVRLWCSPYKRARQTADLVRLGAGACITDQREDLLLGEQQWGLFEGYDWHSNELEQHFPRELAYYRKASAHGGRFWAKVPLGESRFDVCLRMKTFFGTIHRDAQRHGVVNVVIVSHGVTIRAFMTMWLHLSPEWFEVEPNPRNTSIRLVEDCLDLGYIWLSAERPRKDLLIEGDDNKEDDTKPDVDEGEVVVRGVETAAEGEGGSSGGETARIADKDNDNDNDDDEASRRRQRRLLFENEEASDDELDEHVE